MCVVGFEPTSGGFYASCNDALTFILNTQNLVLHDRLELPSPDYKTGVLPRELIEHNLAILRGIEPRYPTRQAGIITTI
jgi:hypothetical protein